jgi:DNA-directed RNA polymerase specialized sigma24 family protein
MSVFRPRSDLELGALDDDALIAHMRAARAAGDRGQVRLALEILVYGHLENVERRVALKVPPADVELVAGQAFDSAFKAAFDGASVGEFRSWLHTIIDRRIADYHRRPPGRAVPLDDVHEAALTEDDETGAVAARSAVDQVLSELNPLHREVVELAVFSPAQPTAAETADRINAADPSPDPAMTEANVNQICSRFRKRLREVLTRGDT